MSCGDCVNCANLCNVCINCDTSSRPYQCNTQQTFCTGSRMRGQLASAYIGAANAPTFVRDDIIIKKFPQATLNTLIEYVANAAKHGATQDSGSWTTGAETRPHIYADKINELLAGIRSINSVNNPGTNKQKDQVIYAEEFNTIMNTINNLRLGNSACDLCNTSCDVTCNTCNSCDTCISCNSCQGVTSYSSHYSSHYSSS